MFRLPPPRRRRHSRLNANAGTRRCTVRTTRHGPFDSLSLTPTMAKATKDSTRQDPVQLEAMVREFLNGNTPTERLRELARLLLTNGDILRVIRELTPEDQGRFVDKVDQVRRLVVSKSSLLTFFHPLRCTRPTRSSCFSLRNSAVPLTDYQPQPRFRQGSRRVEPFPSLPEG